MAKPKNLKDIKIKEVSMVDLPANKQSFLFFKSESKKQIDSLNKRKKIKIGIESNGTVGGTQVTVNGNKLGKLRSFDFSFYGDDPKQVINASYSKVTTTDGGFSRTETYHLTKGQIIMDEKTLKALQIYLGTEDIDFEKKVGEEEIQKAIELITKEYKDEIFPQDLEDAVGVLAKRAVGSYAVEKEEDVNKAGAKFSKDAIKKLKAIIAAVEALKSILPEMKESKEKSNSDDTADELKKQITSLNEAIAKISKGETDTETAQNLKDLAKKVEALEKGGVRKTSLTDQDDTDDDKPTGAGDDGKVLWPTITNQG